MTEFSIGETKHFMLTCGGCGVQHSMPLALYRKHLAEGEKSGGWRCPNGCSRIFRQSEADKLRQERDRLKQEQARLIDEAAEARRDRKAAERRAAAMKGVATRLKNRVQRGVCPCCNRTFANLARHMAGQHPEFDNVVVLAEKGAQL